MPVTAKVKMIRVSPRKVRLVTRTLPGKDVKVAQSELKFMQKGASLPVLTLLNSAIANAENNFDMDPSNLFIKGVQVGEGPTYKRWRARSRGMAAEIKKRTSRISLVLEEKEKGKRRTKKEKKEAAKKPKVVKVKSKKDIKTLTETEEEDKDKPGQKTGYFQEKKKKRETKDSSSKGIKGFVNKMFRRKSEG